MSRDIRFRIAYWSPDLDEPDKWLISLPLTPAEMMFSAETQVEFTVGGYLRFNELESDGAEIVFEQWTGLNDKDGKPIYEGDILRFDLGKHIKPHDLVIEWSKHTTGVQGHGERFETLHAGFSFDSYFGPPSAGRVVGNIHEHPHLLSS